jgi:hypothetical protein
MELTLSALRLVGKNPSSVSLLVLLRNSRIYSHLYYHIQKLQTGSGAHPASYPVGTERGKARPGRDADHSPPSSAEVKYE